MDPVYSGGRGVHGAAGSAAGPAGPVHCMPPLDTAAWTYGGHGDPSQPHPPPPAYYNPYSYAAVAAGAAASTAGAGAAAAGAAAAAVGAGDGLYAPTAGTPSHQLQQASQALHAQYDPRAPPAPSTTDVGKAPAKSGGDKRCALRAGVCGFRFVV